MFKFRKLVTLGLVSLLFAASVPVTANASHVTRIRHPRADQMFSTDSLYYPKPKFSKVPSYEYSQIQDWSGHSAVGDVIGQPEYVEPFAKVRRGRLTWYHFVKPYFHGSLKVTGWIPSYGLAKYQKHAHNWTQHDELMHDRYLFHIRKHGHHKVVPVRRAHLGKSVQSNLRQAAKANRQLKHSLQAARNSARHDSQSNRKADYRAIHNFVKSLKL